MATQTDLDVQDAHNTNKCFDAFIVCDAEEEKVKSTILPFLRDENVTYCELEENGIPGRSYMESVEQLLQQSKKTLIVASAKSSRIVKYVTNIVLKYNYETPENIITLITDGKVKLDRVLERTSSAVHMTSGDWKIELMKAINMTVPEYCRLLGTGKVTDRQFQMGLCLQHFSFDLYGLMISVKEKFLKVNLEDYSQHAELHHQFKIREVCTDCEILCDMDTKVSVILNEDFRIDDSSEEIRKDFIKLALGVIDIATPAREEIRQMVVCTTSGTFGYDQNLFLTEMYWDLQYAVNNKRVGYTKQPFCPNYTDIEKRKESYVGIWNEETAPSIDRMAEAGFLFYEKPDVAICFSCSFLKFGWDVNDDPVEIHLTYIYRCDHIVSLFNTENMPANRPKIHNKINKEFVEINDREKSLEGFNFSKVKTPGGSVIDCQKLRTDLSSSGFFYSGFDVMVKCFSCGLTVLYNDTKVIPWVLHAVLSPYCPFVVEQKGSDFVKETQCAQDMVGCGQTTLSFLHKSFDKRHDSPEWPGYVFRPMLPSND